MPAMFGPDRLAKGSELMNDGVQVYFPHQGASAVLQVEPTSVK
jgi:hypothetical protein